MSEISMSPLLQSQNESSKNIQPQKNDTKTQEQEPKKVNKALIGLGAAAGVSALAIGSMLLFKGRRMPEFASMVLDEFHKLQNEVFGEFNVAKIRISEITQQSKLIQQEAQAVQEKARTAFSDPAIQESYEKIMSLFEQGKKAGYESILDMTSGNEITFKVEPASKGYVERVKMFERRGDELVSQSEMFTNSRTFLSIEEFSGQTSKEMRFTNGKCTELSYNDYSSGHLVSLEHFARHDDSPCTSYVKNFEMLEDDSYKIGEEYFFNSEGRLISYTKDTFAIKDVYDAQTGERFEYSTFNDRLSKASFGINGIDKTIQEELEPPSFEWSECIYRTGIKSKEYQSYISLAHSSKSNGTSIDKELRFRISKDGKLIPFMYNKGYNVEDDILTQEASYVLQDVNDKLELVSGTKGLKQKITSRSEAGNAVYHEDIGVPIQFRTYSDNTREFQTAFFFPDREDVIFRFDTKGRYLGANNSLS